MLSLQIQYANLRVSLLAVQRLLTVTKDDLTIKLLETLSDEYSTSTKLAALLTKAIEESLEPPTILI